MKLREKKLCAKKTKMMALFNDFIKNILICVPKMNVGLKGLVHPKMKINLCFTHPRSILGVYDFLLSDKSNRSYIKNCPSTSKHYNGDSECFLSTVQKT